MMTFLIVVQIILAIALVGLVLVQRSEGGGLGIGGGSSSGVMTPRGTANLLTRSTGIVAALFMANCLLLVVLSGAAQQPPSLAEEIAPAPVTAPAVPSVPLSQ